MYYIIKRIKEDQESFLFKNCFGEYMFTDCESSSLLSFPTEEAANNWLHNNYSHIKHLCENSSVSVIGKDDED